MKQYLRPLILLLTLLPLYAFAGDIIVTPDGSLHEALRQAREWRRTGDPRCQGGIHIIVRAGKYYMEEPLFIRPEDSGSEDSPTVISGRSISGSTESTAARRVPQ